MTPLPESPPTSRVYAVLTLAEGAAPEDLEPHVLGEEATVWRLYLAGHLREMHLLADRPGAVLALEADGAEGARALLASLPMVEAGLLTAEVLPVRPFVNLEALFEPGHRTATAP